MSFFGKSQNNIDCFDSGLFTCNNDSYKSITDLRSTDESSVIFQPINYSVLCKLKKSYLPVVWHRISFTNASLLKP